MNKTVWKKSGFYLLLALLNVLLFLAMVRSNAASPRLSVSELPSADLTQGPFLLTGGQYDFPAPDQMCYTLDLSLRQNACFYFPRAEKIELNGDDKVAAEVYRGKIMDLVPNEENRGHFRLVLSFSDANPSPISTCIYVGTYEQISKLQVSSAMVNYYIQGICFSVMLLSAVLFLFKHSERYLIWLALLAFFRGSYYRLSDLLSLFSWIPGISVLQDRSVYLILTELLSAFFQYKIMQSFGPVKLFRIPFPCYIAAAALPIFFFMHNTAGAAAYTIFFYILLYLCYLLCFLRLPEEMAVERGLLVASWLFTVLLRIFDEFCELGIVPSGSLNLNLRLRGIVSVLFILAFFVVAGKRFAQKFQEADDLNEHLESEIRRKAKQQTLLVRGMLHNLKTPLFSLAGYSDMAVSALGKQPELAQAYMEKAHEKALLAGEMMDRIFLVTQMDSDMVQMQQSPVNLVELLKAVIDTPTAEAGDKQLTLHTSLPAKAYVTGDSLYLRQAFQNLLDNARICTPDHGSITVELQNADAFLTVHIRDTGCGITPEDLPRVFDAYYSNRHGKQQSSGLGLYITREIILRHGGTISVSSTPGKGSDFQVCLPLPSEKI